VKILICGDSFACDWSVKYNDYAGWPNLLAEKFTVKNLAQAGCSEYKILKQIQSQILTEYDLIIISHTSPYRIPVGQHPVHYKDVLHKDSDLLYSDIKYHSEENNNLLSIVDFFENYFDSDAFITFHTLLCEKIQLLTKSYNTLHLAHIDWQGLYKFENFLEFNSLWQSNRGLINHYDAKGNQTIAEIIQGWCCKQI